MVKSVFHVAKAAKAAKHTARVAESFQRSGDELRRREIVVLGCIFGVISAAGGVRPSRTGRN